MPCHIGAGSGYKKLSTMTIAHQPSDLFNTEVRDDTALVAIAGSRPTLSKAQREFNTLTSRIRRLRDDLAQWLRYCPIR